MEMSRLGGQQQCSDLLVDVLAGTHEGRGAIVILDVDVRLAGEQGFDHVHPPVADRQHQGCLPHAWIGQGEAYGSCRPQGVTPLLWNLPWFLSTLMLTAPPIMGLCISNNPIYHWAFVLADPFSSGWFLLILQVSA